MLFDNSDVEIWFDSDEAALEYINNSLKEIKAIYKIYFPKAKTDLRKVKLNYSEMILQIKQAMLSHNWVSITEADTLKKLFIIETRLIMLNNFYKYDYTFNKDGIGTVTLKGNRFVRERS